ncbi:hypothetical protein PP714_10020 [Lacticaseibacillus paracasei]|nr:hypothetical protein [Lacticaseibacillus paracasei]
MDKLSGVVSARRDSRGSNKVTLRDIHTMPHSNTRSSCRCCYSAAAAAAAHTRPGAAVGGPGSTVDSVGSIAGGGGGPCWWCGRQRGSVCHCRMLDMGTGGLYIACTERQYEE